MQALAMQQRTRRAGMGAGSARNAPAGINKELCALFSGATATEQPPTNQPPYLLGMWLHVTEREQTAYSTVRRRPDTAQADHGAMPARLMCNTLA